MFEHLGGSTYLVKNHEGYVAAYEDWVEEEQDGHRAKDVQGSPDTYPVTITFQNLNNADYDCYKIENPDAPYGG